MAEVKLNLGAGAMPIEGYVNLDIKGGCDVSELKGYEDNSVDEIRASHILEHFSYTKVYEILQGWVRKLRQGGVLKIAVPDFAKIADAYVKGEGINFQGYLMGGQTDGDDYHRAIFDFKGLSKAFDALGLVDVTQWQSEIGDCASLPISLNLQGVKKCESKPKTMPSENEAAAFLESLKVKGKNVYSQNGEDGILEAVFEKIGTKNKWCLEVGAADGVMFSNTRRLIEQGWHSIQIEADTEVYGRLADNCKDYPNVVCVNEKIEPDGDTSIDIILSKNDAPKDIDLVVIDIDGADWHIWNQMIDYKPRVVVIEYNPDADNDDFIPAIGNGGQAGVDAVRKLCSSKGYHTTIITDTNVIAIRDEEMMGEPVKKSTYNIKAVMSIPRLCFADNIFSAVAAFVPLNIPIERGMGVFWGQVLSRMIDSHLNDGTDLIFTLDYDTYFTKEQVTKLINLMHGHPEYDALCPLQMKREEDSPLFRGQDEAARKVEIPLGEDIIPVSSGHFGLTVFRVSAIKKLKKPWFLAVPNEAGEWGEGRQDEDIYFWRNFKESGLKLGMAHKIGIGHLQLLTTFPGHPKDNYKPLHLYNNDVQAKGMPDHCKGDSL